MPRMAGQVVLAAGANSGDVLAGKVFEYVPKAYRKAAVQLLACASALGPTTQFKIDDKIYADNELISGDNKYPIFPDHKLVTHGANPASRLFLSFTNPTAGALTIYWVVDIEPL
jgi:hypothetical protein